MLVFRSSSHAPAFNAALEEYLYRRPPEEPSLLLYRNSSSVLIGRNQNVRREADVGWCAKNGVPIVRRISGGGAVYHDLGNLNYAFVVDRRDYSPDRYVEIAVEALRSLGVSDAAISGHHSIWCGGVKLSGSAFALGKAALVHGCILVETDLEMLSAALNGDPSAESAGAGIDSIRVPVANASTFSRHVSTRTLGDAILFQTVALLGCELVEADCDEFSEPIEFQELINKYSSSSWNMERRIPTSN